MLCARCGAMNDETASLCGSCGALLTRRSEPLTAFAAPGYPGGTHVTGEARPIDEMPTIHMPGVSLSFASVPSEPAPVSQELTWDAGPLLTAHTPPDGMVVATPPVQPVLPPRSPASPDLQF